MFFVLSKLLDVLVDPFWWGLLPVAVSDLTLDSTVGEGATFTFELRPISPPPERVVTAGAVHGHESLR